MPSERVQYRGWQAAAAEKRRLAFLTQLLRIASICHLHRECSMLSMAESPSLIGRQYHGRSPHALRHHFISGPRAMRETLRSKFCPSLRHLLTDNVRPPKQYRGALLSLHNEAVEAFVARLEPNRVLGQLSSSSLRLRLCSPILPALPCHSFTRASVRR